MTGHTRANLGVRRTIGNRSTIAPAAQGHGLTAPHQSPRAAAAGVGSRPGADRATPDRSPSQGVVLLWGTVGRLSDPLVDRPDVHPEVHALYLLDACGMGSAGASCFCAFRVGQLRRVDQLDDLHTAVYKAPLDSKRTQPNCFERGQRNPHGLEQAASGAPEDGHSPIVLVGDGKPSTGDRS